MCRARSRRSSSVARPSSAAGVEGAVSVPGVRSLVIAATVLSLGVMAGSHPCSAQICQEPTPGVPKYVDCSKGSGGDGTKANPWGDLKTAAQNVENKTEVQVSNPPCAATM